MVLLWVFVGLIIAWAIARINQSNKLFWILFTSFMVGIAGGSLYHKYYDAQCKTSSSSYCHTLMTYNSTSSNSQVTSTENMCSDMQMSTSVGNGKLEFNDDVEALSTCCVETRKKPPRSKLKKVC